MHYYLMMKFIKILVDFYNEFSQNCDIFQFPHGFDERTIRAILHHLSTKNNNLEDYSLIVNYILYKKFNESYNMLLLVKNK